MSNVIDKEDLTQIICTLILLGYKNMACGEEAYSQVNDRWKSDKVANVSVILDPKMDTHRIEFYSGKNWIEISFRNW